HSFVSHFQYIDDITKESFGLKLDLNFTYRRVPQLEEKLALSHRNETKILQMEENNRGLSKQLDTNPRHIDTITKEESSGSSWISFSKKEKQRARVSRRRKAPTTNHDQLAQARRWLTNGRSINTRRFDTPAIQEVEKKKRQCPHQQSFGTLIAAAEHIVSIFGAVRFDAESGMVDDNWYEGVERLGVTNNQQRDLKATKETVEALKKGVSSHRP
ncbi:MAG: hypothetical protein Q9183_004766, partial [Haloplaca sp. 2 TL-2023]